MLSHPQHEFFLIKKKTSQVLEKQPWAVSCPAPPPKPNHFIGSAVPHTLGQFPALQKFSSSILISPPAQWLCKEPHRPGNQGKAFLLNWPYLCYVLSHSSCVRLFATLGTVAYQAPVSMGFSRQEYWSGLPFSSREGPTCKTGIILGLPWWSSG